MSSHFTALSPAQRRDPGQAMGRTTVQQTRRPLICTFTVLTLIGLTLVILSVVAVARRPALHRIIDPPQALLPGSPFPEDASCRQRRCCATTPLTTWNFRLVCRLYQEATAISVTYDEINQRIVQTAISAQDYTIGDLISIWGTPTGFAQYGPAIDVYWGTHYAALFTCSFQPNSRVKLIIYDLEQHWATAWHGFARNKAGECLGFVKT